jgi:hypothetical protein
LSRRRPNGDDPGTMPVELIAFTGDRRIQGAIPLADDRLSDMLNSVPRVVLRGADVRDLNGLPPATVDVTLAIGSIAVVLSNGRRGVETRRRRTDVHRVRLGIDRYVVTGWLHVPAGLPVDLASRDPSTVLAGRDLLVPLSDATLAYESAGLPATESCEIILINRSLATWMEFDDGSSDDFDAVVEKPKVYHAAMAKDFTGAT